MATDLSAEQQREFELLLDEHQAAVRYYVRSLLPGFHGADDVTQEVLLTLWNKRLQFEPGTNFRAWSFRVAQLHVLNQRRKLMRGNWLIFDEEMLERLEPAALIPESNRLEAEQNALENCLKGLGGEERELLNARYATKTSLETFAERKGVSPGTLKARLFRLRAALRKCIEKRIGNPAS